MTPHTGTIFVFTMGSAVWVGDRDALAQSTPLSQQRSIAVGVVANGFGENCSDGGSDSAEDFGPFSSTVSRSCSVTGGSVTASSTQNSTITPSLVQATGLLASTYAGPIYRSGCSTSNQFYYSFRVDAPTRYTLAGSIEPSSIDFCDDRVLFTGPGVSHSVAYCIKIPETPVRRAFSFCGTLAPGDYALDVFISGSHRAGDFCCGCGGPDYDLQLALESSPCVADFNCDDEVNSADFFDFLAVFFAGTADADFNFDGIINSQDFFDFIAAFFAGC